MRLWTQNYRQISQSHIGKHPVLRMPERPVEEGKMKKEDKERRRQEAVHRDMPVTVLLCIITVTTLVLSGLDGEKLYLNL